MQVTWMVLMSLLLLSNIILSSIHFAMFMRAIGEEGDGQPLRRMPVIKRRSKWLG